MKCLIVRDCCPFHLALHGKHSCQGSVQLSDGPLAFKLPLPRPLSAPPTPPPATQTGPWPHSPDLNHSEPWHPAKRRNRLGIYSPWGVFFKKKKRRKKNAPDCYCLRCNWACKNIKVWTAWHVMKWERQRAEKKRRLTKHLTSNRKMRGRKGGKMRHQYKRTSLPFHETCEDRQGGSVFTLGSNDCHYQTLSQCFIFWPLWVSNTTCEQEQQSVHPPLQFKVVYWAKERSIYCYKHTVLYCTYY